MCLLVLLHNYGLFVVAKFVDKTGNVRITHQAHLRNHCYRGKEIGFTFSECGSVFLPRLSGMQNACALLYCHRCRVWMYHIFPHYLINGKIFGKYMLNRERVLIFSTTFV
jgi:hypothetical protein